MKRFKFILITTIVLFLSGCRQTEYTYHPNGQVKTIEIRDKNNLKHGKFKSFYDSGTIESITEYNHGIIKSQKIYYKNGQLMWNIAYNKEGKMNGKCIEYYRDGFIKMKAIMQKGIFEQYNKYDSIGNLISEYIRLDTNQIPTFKDDYIQVEGNKLYTDRYSKVHFSIPSIPSSQLVPEMVNGTIKLVDRLHGVWEAIAIKNHDSAYIGLKVYIDDSTEYYIGYKKYAISFNE